MTCKRTSTRVFIVIAMLTLSACGTDNNFATAEKAIHDALFPTTQLTLDRESIRKIPYAMITARVGKGKPAILVLGDSDGTTQHWMATNPVSIVTRHGRAVRTVGFPGDIRHLAIHGQDPLAGAPQNLGAPAHYRKYVELILPDNPGHLFQCEMTLAGPEEIVIAELTFRTILLREECKSAAGVKLSARYWVDPFDGFVWQSRQQWNPDQPSLSMSVLKPEG